MIFLKITKIVKNNSVTGHKKILFAVDCTLWRGICTLLQKFIYAIKEAAERVKCVGDAVIGGISYCL